MPIAPSPIGAQTPHVSRGSFREVPSVRRSSQLPSPKPGSDAKAYAIRGASPMSRPETGNGVGAPTTCVCATYSSWVWGRSAAYDVAAGVASNARASTATESGREPVGVMVL